LLYHNPIALPPFAQIYRRIFHEISTIHWCSGVSLMRLGEPSPGLRRLGGEIQPFGTTLKKLGRFLGIKNGGTLW